jgi:hypothetical protein
MLMDQDLCMRGKHEKEHTGAENVPAQTQARTRFGYVDRRVKDVAAASSDCMQLRRKEISTPTCDTAMTTSRPSYSTHSLPPKRLRMRRPRMRLQAWGRAREGVTKEGQQKNTQQPHADRRDGRTVDKSVGRRQRRV